MFVNYIQLASALSLVRMILTAQLELANAAVRRDMKVIDATPAKGSISWMELVFSVKVRISQ